jgi:lipopolysaccharide export system permease protein
VYEQGNPIQDNFIIAKSGTMRVTSDKRFLEFRLRDGWRYQERTGNSGKTEYVRLHFDEYKKQFDLSSFQFNRTADSVNKSNERMLSMRQLEKAIDSMSRSNNALREQTEKEMYASFPFIKYIDSSWETESTVKGKEAKRFEDLIPDSARIAVSRRAASPISSLRVSVESLNGVMKERERNLRWHKIEWHRKISLSLACLVLFLVGAPLGSIIRKGGLGIPLVFAIFFFMIFYFSSTSGEKFARVNTMSPFIGMWLSTFLILPIGLFLTYKAMREAQLFNKEFYFRLTKRVGTFFQRKKDGDSHEPA